MTRLVDIARALGGDVAGRDRVLAPGPGHSARDRSLSVLIDPDAQDGFRVNSFAGDHWRLCRDHVRDLLGMDRLPASAPAGTIATPVAAPDSDRTKAFALEIWERAVPAAGTQVEVYLGSRGVMSDGALKALRFHPACPFRLESGEIVRMPAMLAAMVDIRTNRFLGVHRTALRPDGLGKSNLPGLGNPKKMLGRAKGACVKISPDEDVTLGLHVAEGIETALACMAMGLRPIWAALSAGGIASFPVLTGIEAITIFADNDETGAGMKAARACAARWTCDGQECLITTPPGCGSDWADPIGAAP